MFVCLECGKTFEEPTRWKETHGLDYGPYEECGGSPCCGGAYGTAFECDCCGEWITGEYIKTDNGKRFCENCIIHYELGEEEV